jgi:hypothetical protein
VEVDGSDNWGVVTEDDVDIDIVAEDFGSILFVTTVAVAAADFFSSSATERGIVETIVDSSGSVVEVDVLVMDTDEAFLSLLIVVGIIVGPDGSFKVEENCSVEIVELV